jgi:hypothetical protein
MSECINLGNVVSKTGKTLKQGLSKYSFRNSPPYPANKCQTKKKKGNDGKMYISQADKNGTYKWVPINRGKTEKRKVKTEDLKKLALKYHVTTSGSKSELANRLVKLRGTKINKTDMQMIEEFI